MLLASAISQTSDILKMSLKMSSSQQQQQASKHHPNVVISNCKAYHGLLTKIRDIHTSSSDFAKYSKRLGRILVEDALTELPTQPTVVETPCGQYSGVSTPSIEANCICVVPILRAGNALLDSVLECLPGIPVGSLLLQRDETSPEKTSKHYYTKLPSNIHNKVVLLLDPMIATGGSAIAAIDILVSQNVLPTNILFLSILSAPEGLQALAAKHPQVKIVTAALDEGLNDHKFIVPGLGDFGDRFYGT